MACSSDMARLASIIMEIALALRFRAGDRIPMCGDSATRDAIADVRARRGATRQPCRHRPVPARTARASSRAGPVCPPAQRVVARLSAECRRAGADRARPRPPRPRWESGWFCRPTRGRPRPNSPSIPSKTLGRRTGSRSLLPLAEEPVGLARPGAVFHILAGHEARAVGHPRVEDRVRPEVIDEDIVPLAGQREGGTVGERQAQEGLCGFVGRCYDLNASLASSAGAADACHQHHSQLLLSVNAAYRDRRGRRRGRGFGCPGSCRVGASAHRH